MTAEQIAKATPAWQAVIDRNLLELTLALVALALLVSLRWGLGSRPMTPSKQVLHDRFLALCGLIAMLLLWLLGERVKAGLPGFAFDQNVAGWVSRNVSETVKAILWWVSHLGSTAWLTLLTVVIGFWQWRQGHRVTGLAAMAISSANGLAIRGLKNEFERYRPEQSVAFPYETGFSFPSGHAAGSTLVYCLLAWLLTRHAPAAQRRLAWGLALMLAVGIAATRILIQAHYCSDVLGGILLGLGMLSIGVAWIRQLESRHPGAALRLN